MGCERDYQRTWLYRSEWELIDEFAELSLLECWDFLASAITRTQFVKQFPKTYDYLAKNWGQERPEAEEFRPKQRLVYLHRGDRRGGLKLRPGYRRRYADACYSTITLPCWSRNKLTLLHELAHICCWCELPNGDVVSAHGKEFAGIYLLLVRQNLGKSTEKELLAAMRQHKVKVLAARDTIGTPLRVG
jgi:hypothetical protein